MKIIPKKKYYIQYTMSKPNVTFTVKQMKDYIRQKKLNHPAIKLSMRRAELIEGLKKAGHWNSSKDPSPKKKPTKQPTKPTTDDLSIYYINDERFEAIKVKDPEDPSEKIPLNDYLRHYGSYPKIENVTVGEREWRGKTLSHSKSKYVLVNLLTSKEASDLQKKYNLPTDKTKPYGIYKPEGKDLKKFDTSFYYGWLGKKNLSEKQLYMEKVKYVRKYNTFGDRVAFVKVNGTQYDWDGLNLKSGFLHLSKKVGELRDSSLLNKWLDGKIHKYNIPEVGKNPGLKMKKS